MTAKAVLCVGLRSQNRMGTIAPRVLTYDGSVILGVALPKDRDCVTLSEKVTYLAGATPRRGIYGCSITGDREVALTGFTPLDPVPEWAVKLIERRGWILPGPEHPRPAWRSKWGER